MIWTIVAAFLAALLAAAAPIWLCLKLRTELHDFALKTASQEQLSESADSCSARLASLEELERGREAQAQWLSQADSLNLNRRGQVLRLHRRGESAPEIAAALRMGPGEVKLMIKVYELGRQVAGGQEENF